MSTAYHVKNGVATVTLNRPEKRNALDDATIDDLKQHFSTQIPTTPSASSSCAARVPISVPAPTFPSSNALPQARPRKKIAPMR